MLAGGFNLSNLHKLFEDRAMASCISEREEQEEIRPAFVEGCKQQLLNNGAFC